MPHVRVCVSVCICRAIGLPELDQERMLHIRNAWFEQMGGPPVGNKRECVGARDVRRPGCQ